MTPELRDLISTALSVSPQWGGWWGETRTRTELQRLSNKNLQWSSSSLAQLRMCLRMLNKPLLEPGEAGHRGQGKALASAD